MSLTKRMREEATVNKKTVYEKMDALFRIAPLKVKPKDGTTDPIQIEHRIGAAAGAYSVDQLMSKLGFERRYADICASQRSRYSESENWEMVNTSIYHQLRHQMYSCIVQYRQRLMDIYMNQPRSLVPMFGFVITAENRKVLYLQGLRDAASFKPVVFDKVEDLVRWAEHQRQATYRKHVMYSEMHKTVRAAITLPGIAKDIEHQFKLILAEKELPRLENDGK